ncbi:aladin [Carabus blaptoides fortunei]
MKYEYANISAFTTAVDRHPRVHITRDILHSMTTGDESRALFLPVHEPFSKQLTKIWFEQGFTEAVRFATTESFKNEILIATARWALKLINGLSRIHNVIYPYTLQDKRKSLSTFSQTRNWLNSPIRYIAWHPHISKLAVATSDDSVRIYSTDSKLVPVLKSKLQKNVSCVAWRPLSASEIAIACENDILIWTVDPNSVVTRPSTANACVLRRVNHSPIINIAWSLHGEYLISASPSDPALLVWDVALDQTCTLKRVGNIGNTMLSWSPTGRKLLAASTSLVFRVWECKDWTAERWNTAIGRIQSACWSPCGLILLFVTSEEPVLYSLGFQAEASVFSSDVVATPQMASPVLDLSRIELPNGGLVGGLVQTMEWDPKGRHLAILFQDTNYITIFMTMTTPLLQITPSCLIAGQPGEVPCTMAFQKNFTEGSCLSIAWSSGRLQHFPLIYSDLPVPVKSLTSNQTETFQSSYNRYNTY